MDREPLLEVIGLNKSFGGVKALVDVSLNIFPGEVGGLMGPNGSGKTTLVNIISGFLKPDPARSCFKGLRSWFPPTG